MKNKNNTGLILLNQLRQLAKENNTDLESRKNILGIFSKLIPLCKGKDNKEFKLEVIEFYTENKFTNTLAKLNGTEDKELLTKFLLELGCNIDTNDKEEKTALQLATDDVATDPAITAILTTKSNELAVNETTSNDNPNLEELNKKYSGKEPITTPKLSWFKRLLNWIRKLLFHQEKTSAIPEVIAATSGNQLEIVSEPGTSDADTGSQSNEDQTRYGALFQNAQKGNTDPSDTISLRYQL